MISFPRFLAKAAVVAVFAILFTDGVSGQIKRPPATTKRVAAAPLPKVTQVDLAGLKELLKPRSKPLLINFWATWCDPCREEFPDLVKIDYIYRGKIDFITVSLDDVEDIRTLVPKFLSSMKAKMPAYLLKTDDDSSAIEFVSKDWRGNLPFTILFDESGKTAYTRGGKVRYETLVGELDKALTPLPVISVIDFVRIKEGKRDEALFYYENNWKIYRDEAQKRGVIESYELVDARSDNNSTFDLMLITRYRGEDQLKNSEANFQPILKQLRPDGPLLKNALKPNEFRENVFVYTGRAVFASRK